MNELIIYGVLLAVGGLVIFGMGASERRRLRKEFANWESEYMTKRSQVRLAIEIPVENHLLKKGATFIRDGKNYTVISAVQLRPGTIEVNAVEVVNGN